MVPPGMLLFVLLNIFSSIGERAIYFTPSEVDFLFPAPFSRREILLYKILGGVTAAVYFGLFFPVMTFRYIHSWPAASVGFFLASLMISSLTLCASLSADCQRTRVHPRSGDCFYGVCLPRSQRRWARPPREGSMKRRWNVRGTRP